ncbi:MAG: HAMP domain-containing protein [Actinobacteria bacterium]|nr:HAMP domain-containing protein [Actinomycetota bacterium]
MQLVEGTKRISEGNLDQRVETTSVDELGQLAETFNTMSSNLKNRQEELSKAHQQLSSSYQELRHLDEMKSEFMTTASHELQTPLSALQAYLETFLKGRYGRLSKEQIRRLKMMEGSIGRLTKFVDQLMDIARLEKGKLKLEKKPVMLNQVLKDVVQECLPLIKESNLSLTVEIPEDFPMIIGDEGRLHQVVGNLLSNAIKFTPDGGKIFIHTRISDKTVAVSVSDTGVGIPKEDMPKLFIPFHKLGRSQLLRSSKGLGLGLIVAKGIVEQHGGRIEVVSEKNKGSTFTCVFPVEGGERDGQWANISGGR